MMWAVFCGEAASLETRDLAAILELHPLFTKSDAMIRARRGPGPRIADVPEQAAADAMVSACRAHGLDSFTIARADLIPNPAAQVIRNADPVEAGLEIEPTSGARFVIPWTDFILVTCGALTTGPRQFILDAYVRAAPPHLRFLNGEFNFDYLGERKLAVSRLNFCRFAGDLVAGAAAARRSPSVDALAAGEFDAVPRFKDLGEFEAWNHFTLALMQREKAGESAVRPTPPSDDPVWGS
jgi:hypothetical protein